AGVPTIDRGPGAGRATTRRRIAGAITHPRSRAGKETDRGSPMMFRTRLIAFLFVLLVAPFAASGQGTLSDDTSSRLSTIPHSEEMERAVLEAGLDGIAVRGEGWNETLYSWA